MTGTATTCWQLMVFATCAATSGYFGCKNVELLPFVAKGGGGGGCDNPGLFIDGDVEWAADTTTRLQLARFHEGIFETRNIDDFKPFLDWRGADDE